ncbi:MAG TPA: MFS transporter [Streptosporangiaceae bacterium]
MPSAAPPTHQVRQLALILVAAFMVVLDFSIVNVALPSIERELHLAQAQVQWVVTGYAIAFGGLLILGGRAADLLGRRRMFIAGLVAFSLASLAGGLARDPILLIMSRVVQGAGAAVVAPAALSLITTSFTEGPERTRAIGLYGSISSVGFVAGQVLGGVLVQLTSWRAVFLVNVPVGLLAAALAPRILPAQPTARTADHKLDIRGALLITSAVALAVFAVSQGTRLGWTSPLIIAAALAAVTAALTFGKAETRHPEPLIRPGLMHSKGIRDGSTLAFLLGLWNGGEMLVMSLYLQQVLHESPLLTGLVIAPQGVVGFTMGLLGPRLARHIGIRRLLVVTGATAALGFAALTGLPAVGYSPGFAGRHAHRLRHRRHRVRLGGHRQPRHGRRRPGPGGRRDQHEPSDRRGGRCRAAASRRRERQHRRRRRWRPGRDAHRRAGRRARDRCPFTGFRELVSADGGQWR